MGSAADLPPGPGLPAALARLHRRVPLDGLVTVNFVPDPGMRIEDVLVGAGFGVERRDAGRMVLRRERTLPDWVGPGMRALVCGLNPSVVAADAGYGYAGATNRFWPVALDAGLVSRARDPAHALETDGIGMTDLVKRATPSATVLNRAEYQAGAARVERLVRALQPGLVLFVGLAGWRAAVDRAAVAGWQPDGFGGVPAYVMPSTSGRNAHATRAALVAHIRRALAPASDGTA